MPHGTPDWGLVGPKSTTYGLDDLGEHAVRLGSPHLWDRRGDVVFATDFRDGMDMLYGGVSGLNAAVSLWTGYSRQGAYSVRLLTGSTANWMASINGMLPLPVSSRVGFETSFSVDAGTFAFDMELHWYTGVWLHECTVRYQHPGNTLWCLTSLGLVQFATHFEPLWASPHPCHTMKVVADMQADAAGLFWYVRFILDNVLYDLSTYQTQAALSGIDPHIFFMFEHMGTNAQNNPSYVDNVLVTQNEP